jgi:hypothetical protein
MRLEMHAVSEGVGIMMSFEMALVHARARSGLLAARSLQRIVLSDIAHALLTLSRD